MIKLVYYCEEHDIEIEVQVKNEDFDLEDIKLKLYFDHAQLKIFIMKNSMTIDEVTQQLRNLTTDLLSSTY